MRFTHYPVRLHAKEVSDMAREISEKDHCVDVHATLVFHLHLFCLPFSSTLETGWSWFHRISGGSVCLSFRISTGGGLQAVGKIGHSMAWAFLELQCPMCRMYFWGPLCILGVSLSWNNQSWRWETWAALCCLQSKHGASALLRRHHRIYWPMMVSPGPRRRPVVIATGAVLST